MIEAIIYYLFLIDAIGANIMSYCAPNWYKKKFKKLSKIVPMSKLWTTLYLALLIWVGCTLYRLGILPW
jgi:hypothetical protein